MQRAPVSAMQRLLAATRSIVKQRNVWPIGLAFLCLLIVVLPLTIGPGPVHTRGGGDSPFLLVRLEQLVAGLRAIKGSACSLPIRWMPDAAYGLGYPFFNYYAALPYYVAAGLRLLGWGPIRALQATQALGFALAAATMALLAWRATRHPAATVLATVAYTCAPFHLVNVYVRGDSLSEFYAFVFYPLILWALLRLGDRPSPARVGWLALSYGGLILTHNLSALIFTPFVAAFGLWVLFVRAADARRRRDREDSVEKRPDRSRDFQIAHHDNTLGKNAIWKSRLQMPWTLFFNRFKENAPTKEQGRGRISVLGQAPTRHGDAAPTGPQSIRHCCRGRCTLMPRSKVIPEVKGSRGGARWRTLAWMVGGGLLGLALAATLWWTAAAELDEVWMGVKDIQTSGFFHYAGHWRSLGASPGAGLVQPSFFFDYDATSKGGTPFAMGAVQAAVIALGAILSLSGWAAAVLRKAPGREAHPVGLALFWLLGLALSTFLITPLSKPLWDHVPILPIVQFPWRFLSVQALFGALLAGELARRLLRPGWVALAAAALLTAAAVGGLRPEYLSITEADVTPERLALFESFTANVGTTIRSEYLPANVEPGLHASTVTLNHGQQPPPKVLAGELAQSTLYQRDACTEHWRVDVPSEQAHLAFYTLYFGGWQAWVDDRPTAIEPLPNTGLISLHVPQGEHVITLHLGRSVVRRAADGVSLAALLAIAALFWPTARTLVQRSRRQSLALFFSALVLLGALGAAGWAFSAARPRSPVNDLSMDFDRQPFLHHNPEGIDYGGVQLLSYDYPGQIHAGSTLSAALQWAVQGTQDSNWEAELQLVSPADPLPLAPLPPPLARSRVRVSTPATMHSLSIPEDAASGPYYLALRVYAGPAPGAEEVKALNARGETLGTTYLRPLWVDNPRPVQGDEALWARFGDRVLLRDNVQVEGTDAGWDVRLTWQATAPIAANYTLSLRMLAADGSPLAQRDWAEGPGYGFWPTSAWPVGEWLTDRLRLAIPDGSTPQDAAAMSIVLYDRSLPGYPALGTAVVPLGEREHVVQAPPMERQVGATFGERAVLLGYDLNLVADQTKTALQLKVHWQALPGNGAQGTPPPDYVIFYHLYAQDNDEIVAQSDVRPLHGTYPTNAWQPGQVISDEVVLDLNGVPAGVYRLAVGMYEANGTDRAAIVTQAGEAVSGERLILEDRIEVPAR